MLNVSCTGWPQDDDSSVFLSFRPFFQATVFSKLMQNDPFGRVSIMQFFNYVMRKVWLHQTRIGLSLYDVAGQGYLKESVSLRRVILFFCVHACVSERECVCVLFLQRCMWVCQKPEIQQIELGLAPKCWKKSVRMKKSKSYNHL